MFETAKLCSADISVKFWRYVQSVTIIVAFVVADVYCIVSSLI